MKKIEVSANEIKVANPKKRYTVTFVTSFDETNPAWTKLAFNSLEELMELTGTPDTKEYVADYEWADWEKQIREGVELFCYVNPYVDECYDERALDIAASFELAQDKYDQQRADS